MKPPISIAEKVLVEDTDCWRWLGYVAPNGYGQHGRNVPAHRYVFEAMVGPIPVGLHLDHLCRVRDCVNPNHLEPVTPAENVRRSPIVGTRGNDRKGRKGSESHNGAKTHCAQGHAFDATNTYTRPDGARTCRICNAISAARTQKRRLGRMIDVREPELARVAA